jgi:hypothetical protein
MIHLRASIKIKMGGTTLISLRSKPPFHTLETTATTALPKVKKSIKYLSISVHLDRGIPKKERF